MNPQAVVCNTKVEHIPLLTTLGFDLQNDVISLDPNDPNGYAWNMAADVDDYRSISEVAERLIPTPSAYQNPAAKFWFYSARNVIQDILISLRNAARSAGKEPLWTLRDLVIATSSEKSIVNILRWHDNSQQVVEQIFGHSPQQTSSVMMALALQMSRYEAVAKRWSLAQEQGRTLSLKKWLNSGDRSVLVLPFADTHVDEEILRPLNGAMLEVLTHILFSQAKEQPPKRYFFLENIGRAPEFRMVDTLIAEGRSHRIEVFLDPQNPDSKPSTFRS